MGDMADLAIEQGMWNYMQDHPPLPGEDTGRYLQSMFQHGELYEFDEPIKGARMAVVKRKMPVGTKTKKKKGRESAPVSTEELSLPTERSKPSTRLQDYTFLLFGEKKIGKTDLTAQFEESLHLMTEPGGKAQAIFQRAVPNWRTFQGYVKLLEKDRRFRNVVIDTADILYGLAFDFVMQRMGIEHPSEEAYGKGWKAIRDEFSKWVLRLINTGKGITFISHATDKEIKMRGGEKYDRIQPTLAGQAMDVLTAIVDLWFYYGYDGDRRILTIQGTDHIGAGHRLKDHFRLPNGKPLTEIDMGANAEEAYRNLMDAFANRYVPPSLPEEETKKIKKKKLSLKRRA